MWEDISPSCQALIVKLLTTKEARLTSDQVLAHPWVKSAVKIEKEIPGFTAKVVANLQKFQSAQKLKKAVLTYIATQLSEKELAPLRDMFRSLDKNGDGRLSHEEIKQGLKGRADEKSLIDLMVAIDTDNNGYIEYNGITCNTLFRIFGCSYGGRCVIL